MGNATSSLRLVLITHPVQGAEDFARRLVEERLAACVNLTAVQSIYRWEGDIEREDERLLVVKTCAALLPELERLLAEHHPYDVPECVTLEPEHVAPPYLAWWQAQVR